ncbi:unnamed protein product, partial [Meganyctiphanes norvegica]
SRNSGCGGASADPSVHPQLQHQQHHHRETGIAASSNTPPPPQHIARMRMLITLLLLGFVSQSLCASTDTETRRARTLTSTRSLSSSGPEIGNKMEQQLAAILAAISSSNEKTERALAELKSEMSLVKASVSSTQEQIKLIRQDSNLMLGSMFQPSCDEIAQNLNNPAETLVGVYTIKPPNGGTAQVRCELNRSVGWTIILSRTDGLQPFDKTYAEYQKGFGNPSGEHWIGLDVLHRLTSTKTHQLRVLLEDFDGKKAWVQYNKFQVGGPEDKYRLNVGDYEADSAIGDGLETHNGMPFSTYDQDSDKKSEANCAQMFGGRGGWWYNSCYNVLPTGAYRKTGKDWGGVAWWPWRDVKHSLKAITLMIRPRDY